MEIQLLFCKTCSLQRVCDVTKELQRLFTAKYLDPNTCGICQSHVELKHDTNEEGRNKGTVGENEGYGVPGCSYDQDDDNDDHEDYGLHGYDKNDDNEKDDFHDVPFGPVVVKKEEDDMERVIIHPKLVSEITTVAGEQPVKSVNQEGSRITGLRTGLVTINKKNSNPQDEEFPAGSVDGDTDNEGQKGGDTGVISGPDDSDSEYEDNGLQDGSYDVNDDNDLLSNVPISVKKSVNTKKGVKRPKSASKIENEYVASLQSNQEGCREYVTRLKTGSLITGNYANPHDGEFSSENEESEFESNSEDTAGEGKEDDTDIQSDSDEEINEKVKKRRQMEEDPELVASSSLSKETDENPINFLDPELAELTLPSDDPDRPLRCKFCNATFVHVRLFADHVSDHTDKGPMKKPLKCSNCGKNVSTHHFKQHRRCHQLLQCTYKGCKFGFVERTIFQSHLGVHKGVKRHCCRICGAGFSGKKYLDNHVQIHIERANQLPLKYCKTSFPMRLNAREHKTSVQKHHKESHRKQSNFICSKCTQRFINKASLEQHSQLNTCKVPDVIDLEEVTKFMDPRLVELMDKPRIRDKPFRCKHCPTKEFQGASFFLKHMKYKHPEIDCPVTHAYICNQCDEKIEGWWKLTEHFNTHRHMCDYDGCNKCFKHPDSLKRHKYTHQKHVCHICGKSFKEPSKLKRHVDEVHCESDDRPYKCTYCGKGFFSKGKTANHVMLSHTNSRPFLCDVCGRSFKSNTELKNHNFSHTGERPYACHLCEYRCVRREYLTKHIRIHTGERPYNCEKCKTTFRHKTDLNKHMKKDH